MVELRVPQHAVGGDDGLARTQITKRGKRGVRIELADRAGSGEHDSQELQHWKGYGLPATGYRLRGCTEGYRRQGRATGDGARTL